MSNKDDEKTLDLENLRRAIQAEYVEVALRPDKGFHFPTGRPLARNSGMTRPGWSTYPNPPSNLLQAPVISLVWVKSKPGNELWTSGPAPVGIRIRIGRHSVQGAGCKLHQ